VGFTRKLQLPNRVNDIQLQAGIQSRDRVSDGTQSGKEKTVEDNKVDTTVLVLIDEVGELYAIPEDALERYRLTDKGKAELVEQSDEEVSGYSMFENYLAEQANAHRRAEFRQRSDEILHKAEHAQMAESDRQSEVNAQAAEAEPRGVKKLFTGALATLRIAQIKITKEPGE
jgi:hypothetical protein